MRGLYPWWLCSCLVLLGCASLPDSPAMHQDWLHCVATNLPSERTEAGHQAEAQRCADIVYGPGQRRVSVEVVYEARQAKHLRIHQ